MHHKSIPTKNFIGLKPQMFSSANLSKFLVASRLGAIPLSSGYGHALLRLTIGNLGELTHTN